MNLSIADIRKDYKLASLNENDVNGNPFEQFKKWWDEARNSGIEEPNAMTLATINTAGKPSARIVLLKNITDKGFVFFTNYNSHKAHNLDEQPYAALVFLWKELERQVRIEGSVKKTSREESDSYFQSRPEGSKLGAWASPQSEVIKGRDLLEKNLQLYTDKFKGNIPTPGHWGGYVVEPVCIEFWQGRRNRLHDRIVYNLDNNRWKIERLAP